MAEFCFYSKSSFLLIIDIGVTKTPIIHANHKNVIARLGRKQSNQTKQKKGLRESKHFK